MSDFTKLRAAIQELVDSRLSPMKISVSLGNSSFVVDGVGSGGPGPNTITVLDKWLKKVQEREEIMAKIDELAAAVADVKRESGEMRTAITNAQTVMNGLSSRIAGLQQQLADAIANGGASTAVLESLRADLAATATELDAAAQALDATSAANVPPQDV